MYIAHNVKFTYKGHIVKFTYIGHIVKFTYIAHSVQFTPSVFVILVYQNYSKYLTVQNHKNPYNRARR
jgi:hypothetical protein